MKKFDNSTKYISDNESVLINKKRETKDASVNVQLKKY